MTRFAPVLPNTSTPPKVADFERGNSVTITEPVRICHVSMCLATGGLERLLVDFAKFHDKKRFELQFIALSEEGQPAEEIRHIGCPVRVLNETTEIRKISTLIRLARHLRATRPQIVHTHNTYAHFYGSIAAKLAGVPVIVNTQHGQGCGRGWKAQCQFRIANRLTHKTVGVSRDAARLCLGQDANLHDKLLAIWNGINLDRFIFRGPKLSPTAITVSRLSKEKDFPTLLNAVRIAVDRVPDFKLRIVGDGPERHSIERLIYELKLHHHVELLGERKDVAELLSQAGFYVSATRSEGISLTLLEAMAVGLPIVTTNVGGNAEVVVDGKTGWLVPADNSNVLAKKIIDVCDKRDEWSVMGLLGRQRVEEHFEIRQMINTYESLYEELLSKPALKDR